VTPDGLHRRADYFRIDSTDLLATDVAERVITRFGLAVVAPGG